jgi:hypothetical protein
LGVVADDGTTFKGAEHLGGVEAEHGQVAMVEHAAAVALHPKGVSGIIDDLEVVLVRYRLNGIDITRVTIAMHRHDRRGLGRNGRLNAGRVEIQGIGIHIHEHGLDTVPKQRVGRGDK